MNLPLILAIVALLLSMIDAFIPNRWLLNVAIACLAIAMLV